MTTFLIGDIHGHSAAFSWALKSCGVEKGIIPKGTVICQLGDLVHGPDSSGCLQIALELCQQNPGSYVQLLGNHELHYLEGPRLHRLAEPLSRPEEELLRELGSRSRLAWASHEQLVTHGGLTWGLWQTLGSPESADEAAEVLSRADSERVLRPGWLSTGRVDIACGISCPRTGSELAASWIGHKMPFSQVHGHEGVWWWPGGRFHSDVSQQIRDRSAIDHWRRWSWVSLDGGRLWSIDPKLGDDWSTGGWRPAELGEEPVHFG